MNYLVANWIIKTSGEKMSILVIENHLQFEVLIRANSGLIFIGWDK